jgi:hypothetical protein
MASRPRKSKLLAQSMLDKALDVLSFDGRS